MVVLFSAYLLCLFMQMAVKAEVCGGSSGEPCNALSVYTTFESIFLAASTTNRTFGLCVRQEHQDNETDILIYKYENGTLGFKSTQRFSTTSEQDVVNIIVGNDPNSTYEVQVPYADYEICFVAKYDSAFFGCRLWIYENATSAQITACRAGHAQVCTGTVYDTWNEEVCPGTA
ncbi:uncharacterized protein LOC144146971 [Haemaphysalis longicornis]